jgi:serine-type D-Ala-D-Ala carboxypeptidase
MLPSIQTAPTVPSIETLLTERIEAGDFPSAVYLVSSGESVRFAGALGHAVREPESRPATLRTIYDLASLTKPLITGLLAARLAESGRIELDAPVSAYLREFNQPDKRSITVRHLLTHTSGLTAWLPLYLMGTRERAIDLIAARPLEYEPGTRVVYSDLGFITLGLLISQLIGQPFAEIARREIFSPLALERTFFNPAEAVRTEVAACESGGNAYERDVCERAHGLETGGAGWRERTVWGEVHDGNAYFLGGEAGHAGLFSTTNETLPLALQFLASSSRLLKAETCALFRTNMTEGLEEARSLGWQLAATPESTAGPKLPPQAFGHLGFTGTSCWIDPTAERVFILLTNRTHARPLPFVNINSVRRRFHTLAVEALESDAL